jgi:uncharacterized protein YjiS (DUF1127 family)
MNLSRHACLASPSQQQATGFAGVRWSRLRTGLHRAAARWAAYWRRGQETAVLYGFSDRELWDLGLSRSDIPSVIDGSYRRT